MNVVITGGGTAGHVFPAIALIEAWPKDINLYWLGSRKGIEKKIIQNYPQIHYAAIHTGKLRRYFSWRNFIDPIFIILGVFQALIYLMKIKPHFVFSKGGFVSVPVIFAARLLKIPSYTHESDIIPGLATKINLKFCSHVFLAYEKTKQYLPSSAHSKISVSGNPVRQEFLDKTHEDALKKYYHIETDLPLMIVLGGSLGAHKVNQLVLAAQTLLEDKVFILHQMGENNFQSQQSSSYLSVPYIQEGMAELLSQAQIAISRAGAGALWELAASQTAMILLPLGKATSRGDQLHNAAFLEKNDAAIVLDEDHCSATELQSNIDTLVNNSQRRQELILNAKELLHSSATQYINNILFPQSPADNR